MNTRCRISLQTPRCVHPRVITRGAQIFPRIYRRNVRLMYSVEFPSSHQFIYLHFVTQWKFRCTTFAPEDWCGTCSNRSDSTGDWYITASTLDFVVEGAFNFNRHFSRFWTENVHLLISIFLTCSSSNRTKIKYYLILKIVCRGKIVSITFSFLFVIF